MSQLNVTLEAENDIFLFIKWEKSFEYFETYSSGHPSYIFYSLHNDHTFQVIEGGKSMF